MGISTMNSLRCWIYDLGSEYNSTFDEDLGSLGVMECLILSEGHGVRGFELFDCGLYGRKLMVMKCLILK